ncbi:uncharacterized protein LOC143302244 [Babylonia areolata]|uniref:uncharacterized protein LOC143302244 n=1 Tax=Babylonia areolata TaxID=304850 RepID=UPI003FD4368E
MSAVQATKTKSVADGLRQTSKGQLVYNRELGGKTLTDLLHTCSSVPLLSSPHIEITPPRRGNSVSFGLGFEEEDGTEEAIQHLDDHQYVKCQCGQEEKGEQDSLEKENSPQRRSTSQSNSPYGHGHRATSSKLQGPRSPLSPKVPCQSPDSVCVSPKHQPAVSPKSSMVVSPLSPTAVDLKHRQVVSPKSSQIIGQRSPHVASPESAQVLSPERRQVMKGHGPPVTASSPSTQEETEDCTASASPQDTCLVRWSLNSSGDSESRLEENSNEDEDGTLGDLTLSFTERLHVIADLEMGYDNRSKETMEMKHQAFLQHQSQLDSCRDQQVALVEQQHHQNKSQLHQSIEKKQESKRQEIQQAVEKVKETHQRCSERQQARQQRVEQLGQHLKKEMAKREKALDQKLEEVRAMAQKITVNKDSLVSTLDQCPHKQHLLDVAEKTKLLVRKLSEQAEALAGSLSRSSPLDEVLAKLKQFHAQSQNALDFAHNLTVEAEKKARAAAEAERQQQQQQQQQQATGQTTLTGQNVAAPQVGQTPSAPQPLASGEEGALAAVAGEYERNVQLLSQTDAALDPFVSNQQMKKTRFDLQRAVNTPVNAISPVSSGHLQNKLLHLRSLLKGEMVEVLGKQVSAQATPHGIAFCKNLVAKMIVRKADEQVSSNHESAFAIAAVAVGLWKEFPDVGDLIMAHLQALCPYVLPFYPPRLPNQSSEEYHKSLGYKIVDGNIEQQDKFLRRMSGILRLYAAILVTSPPQGLNHAHPWGLEHAWVWLTRSLNLQPNPDITATAIYDMLQVTGSFLLRAYRVQFVKLLYFLVKVFLPKLKEVAAGSGPVIRLETFLERTMNNSAVIPEPEGYLPPRFWHS